MTGISAAGMQVDVCLMPPRLNLVQTTVGWRLTTCCHTGMVANLGWDVGWRLTPGMFIAACSSRSASSLLPSASSSWALTLA